MASTKTSAEMQDNSHLDNKDHPKWDLTALKRSIPAEYYESDTATSLYYAIRSFVLVTILAVAYYTLRSMIDNTIIRLVISCAYWFAQGTVFWGIFTIGHDCGHRSFSRKQWINDLVGTIWHGFILVPYYPWKASHAHHHKNTGNIEVDEIFIPIKESELKHVSPQAQIFMKNSFLYGLGWIAYLIAGYPGINYFRYFGGTVSDGPCHFNPQDKMFRQNVFLATTSVLFVVGMLIALVMASIKSSFLTVVQYYLIPQLVFCCYLLHVTFLHHASPDTRWLAPSEWTYARGQLENTVDRDYGSVINNVSHNIGTHVVHHLFPVIPHYKLVEANAHLKKYTAANNLPHHEVVHKISSVSDYFKETRNYGTNFVCPDDALIYSTSTGKVYKRKGDDTKAANVITNAEVLVADEESSDDGIVRQRIAAE